MATEDGAPDPALKPAEKPQAPKPVAASFGSSFINKNAGGKKFAPKAVGRRRVPPPAARKRTPEPEPEPAAPVDDLARLAAELERDEAVQALPQPPVESVSQPPIAAPRPTTTPTPAATQDTTPQIAPRTDTEPRSVTPSIASTSEPTPAPPSPGPTQNEDSIATSPKRKRTEEAESAASPKRVRTEEATQSEQEVPTPDLSTEAPLPTPPATMLEVTPATQASVDPALEQPDQPASQTALSQTETANDDLASRAPVRPRPQPNKRILPWQIVNEPANTQEEAGVRESLLLNFAARRHKTPAASQPPSEGEEGDDNDDTGRTARSVSRPAIARGASNVSKEWTPEEPPRRPRKLRKDIGQKRKKRGDKEQGGENGAEAEATAEVQAADAAKGSAAGEPAKKTRRPRKDKGIKRKKPVAEQQEGEVAQEEGREAQEGDAPSSPKRVKPTAPRRRKAVATTTETPDGAAEDDDQPKRPRGRVRETTPSDAEDQRIDPESMSMATIASRNLRMGRMSKRERKMREINWEEVKERRRREAQTVVTGFAARREVDEELNRAAEEAAARAARPQFEMVNGEIRLIEDSVVNRAEADADREIELMEEVEEDDLTVRITTKSFLRESKRFPNEFMLPGQGTRWNKETNEKFYEALRMFGTDFGMIATLFPGSTRRSIKLKFNREERENAAKIKAILNRERNGNWNAYLERSGIPQDAFKDPDAIREELDKEREAALVEINAAKAKAEEERRQRRIAGLDVTDDEADKGEKGKKGRKKREKKGVAFADEHNVEVVEDIGDDGWD